MFDGVESSYVNTYTYTPVAGSSYIPLPPELAAKMALINVKNRDNECLKWALKSALFPVCRDPQRASKYPQNDWLNWDGIEFPANMAQIRKLERQNEGLAINVWSWENKDLIILYISRKSKAIEQINLMLLTEGEKSHYCWIKNFSRLIYGKTKYEHKKFHCELCLPRFSSESVLKAHQEYCEGVNGRPTRIDMPESGKNTLKFENYQNQQKAPYVIYADFESIIVGLPPDPRNRTKMAEKTAKHVACGFAYTVVRSNGKSWSKNYRQGPDSNAPAAEEFLKAIQVEEAKVREELQTQAKIEMRPQDWKDFKSAANCWICEKSLCIPEYFDSVGVWDENTGRYEGQAHKLCRWKTACEQEQEVINGGVS